MCLHNNRSRFRISKGKGKRDPHPFGFPFAMLWAKGSPGQVVVLGIKEPGLLRMDIGVLLSFRTKTSSPFRGQPNHLPMAAGLLFVSVFILFRKQFLVRDIISGTIVL
jgi:hypothetical protein